MVNKVESVTGSREKLHISLDKLLSKIRAAGIYLSAPDFRDNDKVITLDISYFDGLTNVTVKKN